MKSLVIYDSVFGNTEKIALAIGEVIAAKADNQTLPIAKVTPEMIDNLDLLIVGSPTRGFRPTEPMSKFISSLDKKRLASHKVATFDTRIALETIKSSVARFLVNTGGYAAKNLATALKKRGAELVAPPEGFFVTGEQGPLKDGEIERASNWAIKLLNNN